MLKVNHLHFNYSETQNILSDLHFKINQGGFLLVIGRSGSGKSTLLRCLKPELTPNGNKHGQLEFMGQPLDNLASFEIGFVFQDPHHQMVMDKVWHEIAFGLENMQMPLAQMKHRVAEIVQYFKLQDIYNKPVDELSSGQKQIVNLAAVMAMNPKILLLDEPTTRLDPFMAQQFMQFLKAIHEDFQTTIIMVEHRFEEVLPLCQSILWLDEGKQVAFGEKEVVLEQLIKSQHSMCLALPEYMKLTSKSLLLNKQIAQQFILNHHWFSQINERIESTNPILEIKDLNINYDTKRILKDLSLSVHQQEFLCLLGTNGVGKSTLLKHIAFNYGKKAKITYQGKVLDKLSSQQIALLPQDPQVLFIHDSIKEELSELASQEMVHEWLEKFGLLAYLDKHPYDLSGGQQQLLALIKLLLLQPKLLLLDEPTNGIDAFMKQKLGEVLLMLKDSGITILCVSHDLEFCAQFADRCGLLFDGKIEAIDKTHLFFKNNLFYTTTLGRMFRSINPYVLLAKDVVIDE